MTFDEMTEAVENAQHTMRIADRAAEKIARLLVGRLRKVDNGYTLNALKKELSGWDMHRRVWKEEK